VLAAWIALGLDSARRARRERAQAESLGPVVVGAGWRPTGPTRLAVLAAPLVGAVLLEHASGRLPFRAGPAMVGLGLVVAGLVLHAAARRALGPLWSNVVAVRAHHRLIEHGPYAAVRHPIYVAVLLLATGTVLVHTSLATFCLLTGLVAGTTLKIRLEERALRQALPEYDRYAAREPALVPRLRRR
jgi:protein-S-isoprenylcysteine O-methyltransferase Ste14